MTFPGRRVIVLALLVAIAGCGAKKTIVGRWTVDLADAGGVTPLIMEFRPDGTETVKMSPAIIEYKYTIKGDRLQMIPISAKMNGAPMPITAQDKAEALAAGGDTHFTLTSDTLTMRIPSRHDEITLKRVK